MEATREIPLRELHAALGAVFSTRAGWPVVARYGAADAEYRAAREQAGLVDLHERGVLEVGGPQRQTFLQGMLSNEVASLKPGEGCAAAFMSAKGAMLALLRVLADPTAVLLETTAERLAPLQHSLEHYRVAAPVRFAPLPTAVIGVVGPAAGEVLAAAGVTRPPGPPESHQLATLAGRPVRVVRAGDLPGGGLVVHAATTDAAAVFDALRSAGARPLGRDALDALRVEALRPWYGTDVDEHNLLHETGLLAECHSSLKGCYVGQEVVARLEGRGGNVNKALRGLLLEAAVEAGATIRSQDQDVGRVTTAALSPRLGPIAMGYVQRSHLAPGTRLHAGGTTATVVAGFENEARARVP